MRTDLKSRRVDRGLSLRAAAQEMGISTSVLSRAEAGHSVHPSNALAIARFYGCKVTDLWPIDDRSRA